MSKARSINALIFAALLAVTACASASMSAIQNCRALDAAPYELQSDNTIALNEGQFVVSLSADKHQQNFVCTPTTLIRADAATLIVQINTHRTRITVMSGQAIVKDLRERHIIELHSGTVYESVHRENASCSPDTPLEDITDATTVLPAFQTKRAQTALYKLSAKALNESRLAALMAPLPSKQANATATPSARLLSPPTVLSYEVGARFARCLPIPPSLVQHFPPSGIIIDQVHQLVAETAPAK